MNKKIFKVSLLMAVTALCLSSCHCLHHHHGHGFRPAAGYHYMGHHHHYHGWRR